MRGRQSMRAYTQQWPSPHEGTGNQLHTKLFDTNSLRPRQVRLEHETSYPRLLLTAWRGRRNCHFEKLAPLKCGNLDRGRLKQEVAGGI